MSYPGSIIKKLLKEFQNLISGEIQVLKKSIVQGSLTLFYE